MYTHWSSSCLSSNLRRKESYFLRIEQYRVNADPTIRLSSSSGHAFRHWVWMHKFITRVQHALYRSYLKLFHWQWADKCRINTMGFHFGREARENPKGISSGRSIGRGGQNFWSVPSSHLTLKDFFVWVHVQYSCNYENIRGFSCENNICVWESLQHDRGVEMTGYTLGTDDDNHHFE